MDFDRKRGLRRTSTIEDLKTKKIDDTIATHVGRECEEAPAQAFPANDEWMELAFGDVFSVLGDLLGRLPSSQRPQRPALRLHCTAQPDRHQPVHHQHPRARKEVEKKKGGLVLGGSSLIHSVFFYTTRKLSTRTATYHQYRRKHNRSHNPPFFPHHIVKKKYNISKKTHLLCYCALHLVGHIFLWFRQSRCPKDSVHKVARRLLNCKGTHAYHPLWYLNTQRTLQTDGALEIWVPNLSSTPGQTFPLPLNPKAPAEPGCRSLYGGCVFSVLPAGFQRVGGFVCRRCGRLGRSARLRSLLRIDCGRGTGGSVRGTTSHIAPLLRDRWGGWAWQCRCLGGCILGPCRRCHCRESVNVTPSPLSLQM